MVLLCRDDARSFSQISPAAFAELSQVTKDLDTTLQTSFQPDKLNYLMLMMVDPDVHFHVLPRYQTSRQFADRDWADASWPRPVDLTQPVTTDADLLAAVGERLRANWPIARV
jgi:diadenosine tetraphosphate (Ap4A) HIT family hydrolase